MKNLWAKINVNSTNSIVNLLIEQGKYLEKMTDGVLTYDITSRVFESDAWPSKKGFRTDFYIHAPLLEDYKFSLLYVVHDFIESYPVRFVYLDEKVEEQALAQNAFELILGKLLSDSRTATIITNLYSRSKDAKEASMYPA